MENANRRVVLSLLNLAGFIGMVVVNGLANALPINGKTTGQLSDQYPNLFVPAGFTFSIWGLIYLLLAAFSVYQLVRALKKNGHDGLFIDRMGILFLVSCLANLGWIFAWHYEIVTLSLLLMLVLLVSLIGIYLGLGIGRSDARKSERYLVHLPFSVYLGWITVAVIANVTALLVDLGWNRFGLSEQFWTVLVIAAGVALAAVALLDRKDIFYALVVVWALIGILVKRLSVDVVPARGVVAAAAAGIFVLAAGILFRLAGRKTYFQ